MPDRKKGNRCELTISLSLVIRSHIKRMHEHDHEGKKWCCCSGLSKGVYQSNCTRMPKSSPTQKIITNYDNSEREREREIWEKESTHVQAYIHVYVYISLSLLSYTRQLIALPTIICLAKIPVVMETEACTSNKPQDSHDPVWDGFTKENCAIHTPETRQAMCPHTTSHKWSNVTENK